MASKYLAKWRPGFIEAHSEAEGGSVNAGDAKVAIAA